MTRHVEGILAVCVTNDACSVVVLAGLAPGMSEQPNTTMVVAAVQAMFEARASALGSLDGNTAPTVTITNPKDDARQIVVGYAG